MRRRHEGGQDGEPRAAAQRGTREAAARPPPSTPPPARKPRGPRPPPPEAGGIVPPPPARERSRSAARPPAPAAGSHRNRGEQASPRQRARTPHGLRPVKAGEHEPEWYGGPRTHGQNDASDTCFVACRGRAEGWNEAERPSALQAPPGRANGGHSARPPPPPPSPPPGTRTPRTRPTGGAQPQARYGDGPPPPPRHAAPTGRAGQGDSVGPPHPHTRAHSTWVADPNSPPSGRAVSGGGAPDPTGGAQPQAK